MVTMVEMQIITGKGEQMDIITTNENLIKTTEITKICDSIKNNHDFLKSFRKFEVEIKKTYDDNGNGILIEIIACGVKSITKEMIDKQLNNLKQIKEIYEEELKMLDIKTETVLEENSMT